MDNPITHKFEMTCINKITEFVEDNNFNKKTYPSSVTEFSTILNQAHRESLPNCLEVDTPPTMLTLDSPSQFAESRTAFKKSHTCGSLFAKCGCNNENSVRPPLLQTFSQQNIDSVLSPAKRLSNPSNLNPQSLINKRLSNPEINNSQICTNSKLRQNFKPVVNSLNHPEIPYPVTRIKETQKSDKLVPNKTQESKSTNCNPNNNSDYYFSYPDLISNSSAYKNLDYLKLSAIAYHSQVESEEDPAHKFLKESGIIGPMGNGVATTIRKNSKTSYESDPHLRKNSKKAVIDSTRKNSSITDDYEYLKTIVTHLKKELSDLEIKHGALQSELTSCKKELNRKEMEVFKLQREIDKLKSVLLQATSFNGDSDILTSIQEKHAMANRVPQHQLSLNKNSANKKQGVSAESSDVTSQPSDIPITRYEKDFRSKQLIKDAIMENDFLKHLDSSQVREIVDSMYSKEFSAGSYVIREGEAGAHLFVSADGNFEVIKGNRVLGYMDPGKAFGELAILYNCTRTASIRVIVDSKVWVLDRKVFQQIMVRTGLQRLQDNISFLRSVPLLQYLSNDVLTKIADVLEVEFYPAAAYIIRQGASGDTFFIISSGKVKVTQRLPGSLDEEEIRTLERGDYFGEQALLKEDCRTASITALDPGVECLTLDRDSFIQLIGDLSEIKEKDYGDEHRVLTRPSSSVNVCAEQEYEYIKLDDLDIIATLGIGGFGRVELVQYSQDPTLTFALKCLKKQHIVDTQQQEHVFSEKNIMMACRSTFICRLYRTFKDSKYVYMLLEACLGGEVWTILRDRGYFDDHTTRFITACIVEAFDYLHTRGIIYRDLKPENLLLDNRGYVKLVDFGFSKRIGYSSKTWTFCGTPEYVSPETILNKGHDRAVDYWALGILMYELLTGSPPFTASDPMKTYNIILKGIDMIDFARHNVGRSAQSLIKKLCRDSPSERLGYQRGGIQDIKKHKWFQGFDWDGLKSRTLVAPIIQPVKSSCDFNNFDCFGKDNDIPPDEFSGWDEEF